MAMKLIVRFMGACGLLLIAASCGRPASSDQQVAFSAGRVTGGKFIHDQIGVSIPIPVGWHTADLPLIKKAQSLGAYMSSNEGMRTAVESAPLPGNYPLLNVSKLPIAGYLITGGQHNPSLYMSAISRRHGGESPMLSLDGFIGSYSNFGPPYYPLQEPAKVVFGNAHGYHVPVELRYPGITILQDVYGFSTKDHLIIVVISTADSEDRKVLTNALHGLRIDHVSRYL